MLVSAPGAGAADIRIEVVNGEHKGHIQLVVDGKDHLYERELLERDKAGKLQDRSEKRIWQAGPGQSIIVRRRSWSASPQPLTVIVKYFADDGQLIGISRQLEFPMNAAHRWVFQSSDMVSRSGGRRQ
jgi:hypothetical protein